MVRTAMGATGPWTVLNRAALCAALVATLSSTAANGEAALGARVSPNLGIAPCDVVVRAFIEPDPLNRAVSFAIDSGAYYASSVVELDGDRAPRARAVTFRSLAAGSYQVTITLTGDRGVRAYFVGRAELH